jgi:PAS domain S-box-containing protein
MTQDSIKFRARMLDEIEQAVVAADENFRVVYWNRAAEQMFGWSAREVLGRVVLDVTSGELNPEREKSFVDRLRHNRGLSEDLWMRRRDGTRFPVLATVSPLWEGDEFQGTVGTIIDITVRKQLEDAADDGRRRLEEAQRVAKLGSFEHDVETGTEIWSDQYYSILGVDPATTPSLELFSSHVHPDDRADYEAALERYVEGQTAGLEGLWRIVRPDGGIRWLQIRANSVRDATGAVVKIVGTGLDSTEREESARPPGGRGAVPARIRARCARHVDGRPRRGHHKGQPCAVHPARPHRG